MAKGHGSLNNIIRQHDMSAVTVLGVLALCGLWPLALILVFFGLVSSLIAKD
jgi:hypothetical protein